jgi:dolichol-phosphate mannosyltransferase
MDVRTPPTLTNAPQAIVPAPELAVVLPTFNECNNLPIIVERIARALDGKDWEIIVVDDNSTDGTSALARRLGEQDRRIRCIRRIGRRGRSGACIEGALASQARNVAFIDADLQHDETLLGAMLDRIRTVDVDLVVASRYLAGGSATSFSATRLLMSRWSHEWVRRFLGVELTDSGSGFFAIHRDTFEQLAPSLSTQGFKLLADVLSTARGKLRVVELPYVFRAREHGESKLDARVALDFGTLLLAKLTHDAVSFRFVLFCLVGLSGVGVHMSVLAVIHALVTNNFTAGQTVATAIAIAWNFVFNNAFTYSDQRLAGWQFIPGLLKFELICAVGAISNVGIANLIYSNDGIWWIAGLGGAIMGAVWNYAISAAFVWRTH